MCPPGAPRSVDRRVLGSLLALVLLAACGDSPSGAPALDPERRTEVACAGEGEQRCFGDMFQVCRSGYWYEEEYCGAGQVCSYQLGCAACDPFIGEICVGDDVYSCTSEGEYGNLLETCNPGQCQFNHCIEEDCPPGSDLIYVVDSSYRLLAFNPEDDLHTFDLRGSLGCSADAALPGWGGGLGQGVATPFSMSVDRRGQAWVLYTSGQIFWADARNPEFCTLSPWQPGTEGFELFGMGFVSVSAETIDEELFLAGGTVEVLAQHLTGRLGRITPEGMAFDVVGGLTPSEYGPELTGTGGGELFAYFPGLSSTRVAMIDKQTGTNAQEWFLPALPGALRAWAFAHWGGRYYIFVTFTDELGLQTTEVHRFDPTTGEVDVVVEDVPYVIVGAGVSTCAPTLVD